MLRARKRGSAGRATPGNLRLNLNITCLTEASSFMVLIFGGGSNYKDMNELNAEFPS